ncbi:hypothetical protein [Chitinophaga rhizophila]|uniref:Uncharacterized protein n=1 Tax=Chitinophaga rhizophila TaxID=2866212 RepID=A0ABS7GJ11_9BACT|nr:hypothetical protein [Chitinophaga rhizophila]MBW8687702.1 hypothetical protein [Chitinophaga rhizophila]
MHIKFFMMACLLVCGSAAMSQDLSSVPGVPQDALIFVDSVQSKKGMEGLDPRNIALIDVVRGSKLKEKYGPEAENGVIFIETLPFANKRYTRMFSDFSADYKAQLAKAGSDSSFVYVVDGALIEANRGQMLAALERKNIDSVVLATPDRAKIFAQQNKTVVVIVSKTN